VQIRRRLINDDRLRRKLPTLAIFNPAAGVVQAGICPN
jgi:hypothetical protein